ncbi:MAG: hypothetical protein Q7J25_08015 [Vicinamibacterales bacterium]|nr:hypothetical protein [Vicinamibacterales bacterium]
MAVEQSPDVGLSTIAVADLGETQEDLSALVDGQDCSVGGLLVVFGDVVVNLLLPGSRFPGPGRQVETLIISPASELLGTSMLPLVKIQIAVGFIVSPSFKIRAQNGLDVPGYELFSMTGVVFFGAR